MVALGVAGKPAIGPVGTLDAGMEEVDRRVDLFDALGIAVHREVGADFPAGESNVDLGCAGFLCQFAAAISPA